MNDLPGELARRFSGVRRLVVLTGAGMSAESGVPVFRGPDGLWEGHRPEDLATPEAFQRDPEQVWRWYRWRGERVAEARPHAGHRALVELEARVGVTILTQNVDRLHQRSGSTHVLELHGNLIEARCTEGCGRVVPAWEIDPRSPQCTGCARGFMRPAVVWFGEGLDPEVLRAAARHLEEADMIWVVGTSSVVYPAAGLPRWAMERGVPVVEVNPQPTPLSGEVTFSLRLPAGQGLSRLAAGLGSVSGDG